MSFATFIAAPVSAIVDGDVEVPQFAEAVLWAGDLVATVAPLRLSTVLGSCVSVCLFDTVRRFGGMNHFLVPNGGSTPIHGEWSTAELIRRMQQLGSSADTLEAKVFGGGSPLRLANETYAVGPGNVAAARQVLAKHEIPIRAERTGHEAGVKVYFENWTGVVWFKAHSIQKAA